MKSNAVYKSVGNMFKLVKKVIDRGPCKVNHTIDSFMFCQRNTSGVLGRFAICKVFLTISDIVHI